MSTPIHAFGERVTVPQCTRLYSCMSSVCDCASPYESVSPYPLVGATTTIHQQLARNKSYMYLNVTGDQWVCLCYHTTGRNTERTLISPTAHMYNKPHTPSQLDAGLPDTSGDCNEPYNNAHRNPHNEPHPPSQLDAGVVGCVG